MPIIAKSTFYVTNNATFGYTEQFLLTSYILIAFTCIYSSTKGSKPQVNLLFPSCENKFRSLTNGTASYIFLHTPTALVSKNSIPLIHFFEFFFLALLATSAELLFHLIVLLFIANNTVTHSCFLFLLHVIISTTTTATTPQKKQNTENKIYTLSYQHNCQSK